MVADKSHNLQVSQQTGDSGIAGVPAQVQRQEKELVSPLEDRQAGGSSLSRVQDQPCSLQTFKRSGEAHPHQGGQSASFSLLTQMFIHPETPSPPHPDSVSDVHCPGVWALWGPYSYYLALPGLGKQGPPCTQKSIGGGNRGRGRTGGPCLSPRPCPMAHFW